MVLRQKIWIDRNVQGVLVGRIVLYWSGLLLYFGISMGCFQWLMYPEWTLIQHLGAIFEQVWPCLPTFVLLLPLVIFDMVRLSNRFVGPVYRLRMHLGRLNANSNTYPLNFRDDDYWQQLAEPINQLQRTILGLEKEVARLRKELTAEPASAAAAEAAADPSLANATPAARLARSPEATSQSSEALASRQAASASEPSSGTQPAGEREQDRLPAADGQLAAKGELGQDSASQLDAINEPISDSRLTGVPLGEPAPYGISAAAPTTVPA